MAISLIGKAREVSALSTSEVLQGDPFAVASASVPFRPELLRLRLRGYHSLWQPARLLAEHTPSDSLSPFSPRRLRSGQVSLENRRFWVVMFK